MSFISDGKKTWDPDRQLELQQVSGGKDDIYTFLLIGPQGSLHFFAEWKPYKIEKQLQVDESQNPNINTITEWIVSLNSLLPNFDKISTQQIIREAMKSYGSLYGKSTLMGYPARDVICKFEGKFA